jgi:hypothetical protein
MSTITQTAKIVPHLWFADKCNFYAISPPDHAERS